MYKGSLKGWEASPGLMTKGVGWSYIMALLATDDGDNLKPPVMTKLWSTNLPTLKGLEETQIFTIEIGILVLPAGFESACGIMTNIFHYLDIRSLVNVKRSSLIHQLGKAFESDDFVRIREEALSVEYEGIRSINEMIEIHPARRLYLLIERYKAEFPRVHTFQEDIPTPFICACEKGRMDDVELFVKLDPFHKYITNRDVNVGNGMTLYDTVSEEGIDIDGGYSTPLMAAAENNHFPIVEYLIEEMGANPNIANRYGWNVLHVAVMTGNTDLIKLLLSHMDDDSINQKEEDEFETPLDYCYSNGGGEEIIALIRAEGGEANNHDENGRFVGIGEYLGRDTYY